MGTVHDQLSVNNNHMNRTNILPIVLLNTDCQVNMNVNRIQYKIHFPILPSTKTMSNESLSSQYILQKMLPILKSATRLPCTISYMFWLLSSLTLFNAGNLRSHFPTITIGNAKIIYSLFSNKTNKV
jgi:hypothetical protein